MNIKDADEIIRRSQEKGVKVCVSHQNRFNIAIQKTRKAWKPDVRQALARCDQCPLEPRQSLL
jgi:hypothetical protein